MWNPNTEIDNESRGRAEAADESLGVLSRGIAELNKAGVVGDVNVAALQDMMEFE